MELSEKQRVLMRGQIEDFLKTNMQSALDWCFACGAGRAVAQELFSRDAEVYRELISKETIKNMVESPLISQLVQKDIRNAWCFACGAGKSSTVGEEVINPIVPAAEIDKAVTRIIEILKE